MRHEGCDGELALKGLVTLRSHPQLRSSVDYMAVYVCLKCWKTIDLQDVKESKDKDQKKRK